MSHLLFTDACTTSSSRPHQNGVVLGDDGPRKMTCRTPSSASSRSSASAISSSSSSSSSNENDSWSQFITSREIYKAGRLKLLADKKGLFWRHDKFREEPYWCLFCIHEEIHPFLELYDDHKASLTHKPTKVIPLINCQHVTPNISLAQHFHSFTLTLASETHQFSAGSSAEMHDWITTIRARLQDLQSLESDRHAYTRCPLLPKSDRLLSVSPEVASVVDKVDNNALTVELNSPAARRSPPNLSSSPCEPTLHRSVHTKETVKRPEHLPALSSVLLLQSVSQEPASPPAHLAPPIPCVVSAPPIPPRGMKPMRAVPHSALSPQIPPPPPPRLPDSVLAPTIVPSKPPRPPRKEDKRTALTRNPSTDTVTRDFRDLEEQLKIGLRRGGLGAEEEPLIFLAHTSTGAGVHGGGIVKKEVPLEPAYGTLFQRKRQMLQRPPAAEVAMEPHRRETRSQTASPALSDRSVTSTASEPGSSDRLTRPHGPATTWTAMTTSPHEKVQTLRQQQVERLKQEIHDPHGVTVGVKRRDCVDSLALVDCFGCVWIAGWKQRECPHFHSLFHLLDQVLSVNGIYVSKAADVFRLLKDSPTNRNVMFHLSRTPRGRVFVLAREYDGQDLGLLREGKTAEIRTVSPDGLAAQNGLPTKAITCDGNNLCNWVLTEINHRPLNWYFKDNEIDDRLRAVGKEISVLVQPSDLVNATKKQLKMLRNYKDYIVQ